MIVCPNYSYSHRFPSQVRFSDEKWFSVWGMVPVACGGREATGTGKGCVKHSKAVMMHMIICSDGTSTLTKCDDRQDRGSFQRVVLTPNLNWIRHRTSAARAASPIVFQQDGAPSHTSVSTQRFMRLHRVSVLPDWPPNSPDLNRVEYRWA